MRFRLGAVHAQHRLELLDDEPLALLERAVAHDDRAPRLHGQRRWNRRLWRRLAQAAKAVAGRPVAEPHCASATLHRAARRALRRHGGASWGTAEGSL